MVQLQINLSKEENIILTNKKLKEDLKTKAEAARMIIRETKQGQTNDSKPTNN